MKLTKRAVSLVLSVVIILGLVLSAASCTAVDSTKALFEKALGRTLNEVEGFELAKTVLSIVTQGSVEVDVESTDEDLPISGSVKIFSDADDCSGAVKVSLKADDEKLDGVVFFDENELSVSCDEILGKTYGVSFKNFEENFKKSVFNPESETEYALPEGIYEEIINIVDLYREEDKALKESQKVFEKFEAEFYKAIEANAELEKENTEVDILEYDDVKATLVTVSIDEEGLAKAIDAVWKKMKSDKTFKSWLEDYIIVNSQALDIDGEYESADELISELDDRIDEYVEDLEDDDLTVTLSLYLNRSSGAAMRADASVKTGGTKYAVSVELGNKFKSFEGFKLTVKTGSNAKSFYLRVVEDTKEELKVKLEDDFFGTPEITAKYDRKDGDLTVTSVSSGWLGETKTVIKLNYTEKSGTHTLKFLSLSENGDKADIPADITLIIREKDSMPSVGKYTEFFTLDSDAMDDFIETLENNFENLTIFDTIADLIDELF